MNKNVIVIIVVLVAVVGLGYWYMVGGGWAIDTLNTRVAVTVPEMMIADELEDFVLYVDVAYDDAAFTDLSGNLLASDKSTDGYWVKLPKLSATENTFYMYHNGTVPTTDNPWEDYLLVFHFDEITNNYQDSSPNNFHAAETIMGVRDSGYLGDGPEWTADTDIVKIPHHPELEQPNIYAEMWVRTTDAATEYALCSWEPRGSSIADSNNQGWNIEVGWNEYDFVIQNGETGRNLTTSNVDIVEDNTWYHLILEYTSGDLVRIYVNGEEVADYTLGPSAYDYFQPWQPNDESVFYMGHNGFALSMRGNIDELRYSGIPKGANWAYTCYQNQKSDTSLIFGAEETK